MNPSFDNLAPKLLINQVLEAPVVGTSSEEAKLQTHHGLLFNRVHLQGHLIAASPHSAGFQLAIQDSTAAIPLQVASDSKVGKEWALKYSGNPNRSAPELNSYVAVIGTVLEQEETLHRFIAPTKVVVLLENQEELEKQWLAEVKELDTQVSGDESATFRHCVNACTELGCAQTSLEQEIDTKKYCSPLCSSDDGTTDIWLHVAQWDCSSDCNHRCMWLLEDLKPASAPVEKYFGKWPFIRMLGAQEPASVVFSILNLLVNAYCLLKISAKMKNASSIYPMLWMEHFLLSINAWFWSTVFHTRDTRFTEKFDYFSAGALVAFNLFLTIARVFELRSGTALATVWAPILSLYLVHVHRMVNILFDYGLHVMLCVVAGAVQTIAWALWAFCTQKGRQHPGRQPLLHFMALVNAATLLEVLDFPPIWGVFDAHSLWHAATSFLTLLWYQFVSSDVDLFFYSGNNKKT